MRDAYLRYTAGLPADVWITLGDNAYPNGRDGEFQTGLFDAYPRVLATLPIWPSFGNHDRLSASADAGCGPYFAAFTLPERAEAGGSPRQSPR